MVQNKCKCIESMMFYDENGKSIFPHKIICTRCSPFFTSQPNSEENKCCETAIKTREEEIALKLKEMCNKCKTERGLARAIGNFINKLIN